MGSFEKQNGNWTVFATFGLAFAMLLTLYIAYGVYPFGPNHILQVDAVSEYVPRVNETLQSIKAGRSLFYSWQGGLGNDAYFGFVTTMLNPLIYIGLLLKPNSITELFMIFYLIQIPACAAAFSFYIKNKTKHAWSVPFFSVMYGFCAYIAAFFWTYYWLAPIMMLPFVALGIEKLFESGKIKLYGISLGLGILFNYQLGVFLCLFSVLHYTCLLLKEKSFVPALKRTWWRFAAGSLLAAGMAAIALVPAIVFFPYTSYSDDATVGGANIAFYFSLAKFMTAHYFLQTPTVLQFGSSTPNVYASVPAFLLAVAYFANPNIPRKEKLSYVPGLVVIYLFLSVEILDFAIHGFHFSNGLPHRLSFLYSFYMIRLAVESFEALSQMPKRRLAAASLGVFAFSLFLFIAYPVKRAIKPGLFTTESMLANIALLLLYFALGATALGHFPKKLGIPKAGKHRKNSHESSGMKTPKAKASVPKVAAIALAAVLVLELGINTSHYMNEYKEAPVRDKYILEFGDQIEELKAEIDADDKSGAFYRAEHYPNRVRSDGKLFGYNGVSIFSISSYADAIGFLGKLGVMNGSNNAEYRFGTPLASAFLGVKYSFNRDSMKNYRASYFKKIAESGNVVLNENQKVLPLGFMVSSSILYWDAEKQETPFKFQDMLAERATGLNKPLFGPLVPIESFEGELLKLSAKGDGFSYEVDETAIFSDVPKAFFELAAPEDGEYAINIGGDQASRYRLEWSYDGKDQSASKGLARPTTLDTFQLGYMKAGTKIHASVEIENLLKKNDREDLASKKPDVLAQILSIFFDASSPELGIQSGSLTVRLAKLDNKAFEEAFELLADEPFEVSSWTNTEVRGSVTAKEDGVFLATIPYDKRWHLYVDGAEHEPDRLLGTFIGLPLQAGAHEILLEYKPTGIKASFAISLLSLAALVAFDILIRKKEN
ncbi:MAG: YfhO family protein [Clostridiales bacterium]|nr:YfhO family protein [Clostridiales bacterium]